MNAKEWLEKLEHGSDGSDAWDMLKDLRKAEAEVERLRTENIKLRAALEDIADFTGPEIEDADDGWAHVHNAARNALKGSDK